MSSCNIFKLEESEVRKKLRNQLTASVGTYGSQRGCPIATAIREFKSDWYEDLHDYVSRLKFKNIVEMLKSMPESFRFEESNSGLRICAVSNKNLHHCFDLIDRTRPKLHDDRRVREFENRCRYAKISVEHKRTQSLSDNGHFSKSVGHSSNNKNNLKFDISTSHRAILESTPAIAKLSSSQTQMDRQNGETCTLFQQIYNSYKQPMPKKNVISANISINNVVNSRKLNNSISNGLIKPTFASQTSKNDPKGSQNLPKQAPVNPIDRKITTNAPPKMSNYALNEFYVNPQKNILKKLDTFPKPVSPKEKIIFYKENITKSFRQSTLKNKMSFYL